MNRVMRNTIIVILAIILIFVIYINFTYTSFGIEFLKNTRKDKLYSELTKSNIEFNKELIKDKDFSFLKEDIEINNKIEKIKIVNPIGKINIINNNNDDQIKLEIVKLIENTKRTSDENNNMLEDIDILIEENEDSFSIECDINKLENILNKSDTLNIEYNISIPKSVNVLEIIQFYGDTNIENYTGDLILKNYMGDIYLENVKGYFDITTELGSLKANNIITRGSKISNIYGVFSNMDLKLDNPSMINIQILNGKIEIKSNPDKYNLMVNGKLKRERKETQVTIDIRKFKFGKIKENNL